jgi:hypothetical protein
LYQVELFQYVWTGVPRELYDVCPGNALTVFAALLAGSIGLSLLTMFLIWKNNRK